MISILNIQLTNYIIVSSITSMDTSSKLWVTIKSEMEAKLALTPTHQKKVFQVSSHTQLFHFVKSIPLWAAFFAASHEVGRLTSFYLTYLSVCVCPSDYLS